MSDPLTTSERSARDLLALTERELASALECIRDIASMRTMSKRQRIISERAITWLRAHGYPEEPGGYIPGVGFTDEEKST
jgi:hypothetical protein